MNIFESEITKVRVVYALNFLVSFAYVITYGIGLYDALIVYSLFAFMNGYGVVLTYHRYYSHKSFKFSRKLYLWLGMLAGMVSCSGSALGWAGIHRTHHRYEDTDKDPHRASRGIWAMASIDYKQDFSPKCIIDLARDKFVVLCHKYYFVPAIVYAVCLFAIGNIEWLVIGYCIPAFLTLLAQGLTNFYTHRGNKAVDVPLTALINFGDNWHREHHNNQSSTRINRWDLAGLFSEKIVGKNHV